MATSIFKSWFESSAEDEKLFAEESLVTEVLDIIHKKMNDEGISKTELASKLNTSKANISTILNGSRNITLRTISNLCYALKVSPKFDLLDKEQKDYFANDCDYFDIKLVKHIQVPRKRDLRVVSRAPENGEWFNSDVAVKVA